MIELHLIGYTADLDHLVLDIAGGGGGGRYRLVIDGDLFATLDQIREQRQAEGKDVGPYEWVFLDDDADLEPVADQPDAQEPSPYEPADEPDQEDGQEDGWFPADDQIDEGHAGDLDEGLDLWADDELAVAAHEAWTDEPIDPPGRVRLVTADEADSLRSFDAPEPEPELEPEPEPDPVPEPHPEPEPAPEPEPQPDPEPVPESRPAEPSGDERARRAAQIASPSRVTDGRGSDATLSPAEIQAMLRAGRSPRSVAKAAGTDVAWVERWLAPIEAERRRIRERAHAQRLERPRLGRSREPLAVAVERNLRARGVSPDELSWDVGRRADGRWRITVRFTQRGRNRSATWTFDPEQDVLTAASELARELGFIRPPARRRASTAKRGSGRG